MNKCIKDYKRHSNTYLKGQEYDISAETSAEHEEYFGEQLWENASGSKKKKEGIVAKAKSKVTGKKAKK